MSDCCPDGPDCTTCPDFTCALLQTQEAPVPEPMTIRSVTWNGLTLEEAQAVVAEAFATFNPDVTVWLRVGDPSVLGAPVSYDVDTDGLTLARIQAIAGLIEARRAPAVEAQEATAAAMDDGLPCFGCGHGHYWHHRTENISACTTRVWDAIPAVAVTCPCPAFLPSADDTDAPTDAEGDRA